MVEPITVRFTPSVQDYVRVTRTLYTRHPINWVFYGLMIIFSLISLCLLSINPDARASIMLLPAATTLVFALLGFIVQPWLAGNRARKNDRSITEVTWIASEETILLKTVHTESKTDWGTYKKVFETDDYIFFNITTTRNFYHFIPKRAFESPEQLEAFRALVKTKLPGLK